ncbi:hypothetical protein WAI453_004821 [Rhynchosporium graminicola]
MESVTVIGSQVASSGSREIATNPEELKYLIDGHTAQEWEALKDPFLKLYLGTGRTPFEVRTILEETHQFRTTDEILTKRFNVWMTERRLGMNDGKLSLQSRQALQTLHSTADDEIPKGDVKIQANIVEETNSDHRSKGFAKQSAETQATTATSGIEDEAEWEIELNKLKISWFANFDKEILDARESTAPEMRRLFQLPWTENVDRTIRRAWDEKASKFRQGFHGKYSLLHNSALEASKNTSLSDSDKGSWRMKLHVGGEQIQADLIGSLPALRRDVERPWQLPETAEDSPVRIAWRTELEELRASWVRQIRADCERSIHS